MNRDIIVLKGVLAFSSSICLKYPFFFLFWFPRTNIKRISNDNSRGGKREEQAGTNSTRFLHKQEYPIFVLPMNGRQQFSSYSAESLSCNMTDCRGPVLDRVPLFRNIALFVFSKGWL